MIFPAISKYTTVVVWVKLNGEWEVQGFSLTPSDALIQVRKNREINFLDSCYRRALP